MRVSRLPINEPKLGNPSTPYLGLHQDLLHSFVAMRLLVRVTRQPSDGKVLVALIRCALADNSYLLHCCRSAPEHVREHFTLTTTTRVNQGPGSGLGRISVPLSGYQPYRLESSDTILRDGESVRN